MSEIYSPPESCTDYLNAIDDVEHRSQLAQVLGWVDATYPELLCEIKWNQPMFSHHGTFIIGFSSASKHFSVAPEFLDEVIDVVEAAGLTHGKKLFRIEYDKPVPYEVLRHVIEHNLEVKADVTTYWRKR
ncbi:MAG: DUF1801 domain-containing protein [Corynebacterium sp.]|nr:DUF1801 domain-containing protein [Corynebacterium sp.]